MRTFRIILFIASAQLLFSYSSAQENPSGVSPYKPLHNPEDMVENYYSQFGKKWAIKLKEKIKTYCTKANIQTMRIQILFFAFNNIDNDNDRKTALSEKLETRTYIQFEKKIDNGVAIIPSDELKEKMQGKVHQGSELPMASNERPTHYIKCMYSVDNETIEIKSCSLTDAINSQNEKSDFGTFSFTRHLSADVKNLIRADDNKSLN